MNKISITYLGVGLAVAVVLFIILWRMGAIARFTAYVQGTKEELKKCTWPSWDELKGSTMVVMITMVAIGLFTIGIDYVIALFVRYLNSIVV